MLFKRGNRPEEFELFYDNVKLDVVKEFTYLGVNLSSNGLFYKAQKRLSDQGLKALFALNSLFDSVELEISDKIKLFDSMVLPILCYGSEIWGFHKSLDIERVHLKFLKKILSVRQQTSNASVYGELGRFPLFVVRQIRIIKYWYKICKTPDTLLFRLYNMKNDQGKFINSWTLNVHRLLENIGFNFLIDNNTLSLSDINCVVQRIYDIYVQNWFSELDDSNKLASYRHYKKSFELEKYISCVTNSKLDLALTRFRCSAHRLLIEEGRYRNIPRDHRTCTHCNMNLIENEYHFLLVCPKYRELRNKMLPRYFCSWPNINKFISLLSSNNTSCIKKLANYIFIANKKREETTY